MSGILKARPASVLEASYNAQMIAFAPVAFQTAKCLRDLGILELLASKGKKGIAVADIAEQLQLREYAVRVLLEVGGKIGLAEIREDGTAVMLPTGRFILSDDMTRINMDFTHDVCYQGLFHLEEALVEAKPAGLKVFGEWATVYEALSKLPEKVRESWLEFDHYYSDSAFPAALPFVFKDKPAKLMDVGGNTGKFSIQCCEYDPDVQITILDLPGQCELATENLGSKGLLDRIALHPINMLDRAAAFPEGQDAIWMSQFLVCFSEDEVVSILKRAGDALAKDGALFILDTFCDRQMNEVGEFCLEASSLYFTCMANGNSRMYTYESMAGFIEKAGLKVVDIRDHLGVSHSLIRCARIES